MKLEELLNKLINLWWKPRRIDIDKSNKIVVVYDEIVLELDNFARWYRKKFSLNDLCSLDSWLREFVCWLDKDYLPFCSKCNIKLESNNDKIKWDVWYEEEVNFRLMLSSIQEDKEKFILDNIVLK